LLKTALDGYPFPLPIMGNPPKRIVVTTKFFITVQPFSESRWIRPSAHNIRTKNV